MGTKLERLNGLRDICEKCGRCSLSSSRKKLVFGEGDVNSNIMSIAEAPGKDEDISGRPFVGKSGKLYRDMLQAINISPERDLYMANVLKCRPPGNRKFGALEDFKVIQETFQRLQNESGH